MAHYVDTHPDFTDCFVLRSATTGEWQYVGDEDYVIEMVDGWGDVVTEAIGYTTRELAEQAAAKHGGCGACQTSCQSACKTSCTVGNQVCKQK